MKTKYNVIWNEFFEMTTVQTHVFNLNSQLVLLARLQNLLKGRRNFPPGTRKSGQLTESLQIIQTK